MSRNVHVQYSSPVFATDILVDAHRLRSDEPADVGGGDTGATPREILLGALGACTAITLRMYAQRKQWPLEDVQVQLSYAESDKGKTVIKRDIKLIGVLDETQRQRLLQIANACPVHKMLTGAIEVPTTIAG